MIVGVDLGKTGCRAAVAGAAPVEEHGAPGLGEPGGADAALAAVDATLDRLLVGLRDQAPTAARPGGHGPVTSLCVGAAGAEAAPAAARRLAEGLAERHPTATVAVTSDSVTAHAGALAGRPGSVLAVGTGVVALSVAADGRRTQLDGWGPWLGDEGGGAWIGREALRAVLRAREGRGPETLLTAAAERRYGDLVALPATLAEAGGHARATAALTPDVLAVAGRGDEVAQDVLDRAVACWADLAARAVVLAGEPVLALTGGLADVSSLTDALTARLPDSVRLTTPHGTPLDGALLLAEQSGLPHEPAVLRVGAAVTS